MHAETNILFVLLIYLAAMVAVVPLAKRFGLGVVLGYLLAGVVIGPFGLGFAKSSSNITLLAELGIVLMLFTIGLELDIKRLWSMRMRVFGFGALQMLFCGAGFAAGVHMLGLSPVASMLVGLTLALSSTAVAVQLMNDRNLMGSTVGQSAFGILLFQDMAAIPILIGISLLYPSEGATAFKPLYALAAVAAVVVVGKYLVGYLLGWIAKNGSRELFVGAALLVVIVVMEGMTMVGVSAGLGAFIAGVMLASSEYRHELERIWNRSRVFFSGYFLSPSAPVSISICWRKAGRRSWLCYCSIWHSSLPSCMAWRCYAGSSAANACVLWPYLAKAVNLRLSWPHSPSREKCSVAMRAPGSTWSSRYRWRHHHC